METRSDGWLAGAAAATIGASVLSGSSCIIPDHGIVALVDCGARWCATADLAEAFNAQGDIVQVQEIQPDGSVGWVTACVCMKPTDDAVLLVGEPPLQYELLRNLIIDASRQACLDVAAGNGLDPDPPYPLDEQLEPSCYEAVTSIFRDGCCKMLNADCGTNASCDAEPDPTGGEATTTTEAPGTADTTASPDSSTGEMSSLEPFYDEIECDGAVCRIGQPLIDAVLATPELLLAEGTSLRFEVAASSSRPIGLELQGVEPDTLAGRLGLRDHDVLLRIDALPLTNEAELVEAATYLQSAESVTVLVLRDGDVQARRFARVR